MAIEIERKFLVTGDGFRNAPGVRFSQGYLSHTPERTVRVRIAAEQAFLTIKGATHGATRLEFEYPIPLADAQALLALCGAGVIDKVRHTLVYQGKTWEVDVFAGANQGLVVAEIELQSEDESFAKPEWLGEEVTHDPRYYNANLSTSPYAHW
ncbi:CYTH domain-containing protein [Lampropedia puyangensis]|uniref:CYTH domain-containing protein n=1 Tax=Lampropedia puyangensis TaxID=1330072 RepID=A0A4S8FAJ7_9BURK|nr:CYTH domain-containing protein [Lampropedia puyangensis]THU04041.1 CYTH domain-containing protein [Lampropedia puyangensis]